MSESSKQTDIVNDILDAAFDKPWAVYSLEKYKHQLAETQAEVKKLTPRKRKNENEQAYESSCTGYGTIQKRSARK